MWNEEEKEKRKIDHGNWKTKVCRREGKFNVKKRCVRSKYSCQNFPNFEHGDEMQSFVRFQYFSCISSFIGIHFIRYPTVHYLPSPLPDRTNVFDVCTGMFRERLNLEYNETWSLNIWSQVPWLGYPWPRIPLDRIRNFSLLSSLLLRQLIFNSFSQWCSDLKNGWNHPMWLLVHILIICPPPLSRAKSLYVLT